MRKYLFLLATLLLAPAPALAAWIQYESVVSHPTTTRIGFFDTFVDTLGDLEAFDLSVCTPGEVLVTFESSLEDASTDARIEWFAVATATTPTDHGTPLRISTADQPTPPQEYTDYPLNVPTRYLRARATVATTDGESAQLLIRCDTPSTLKQTTTVASSLEELERCFTDQAWFDKVCEADPMGVGAPSLPGYYDVGTGFAPELAAAAGNGQTILFRGNGVTFFSSVADVSGGTIFNPIYGPTIAHDHLISFEDFHVAGSATDTDEDALTITQATDSGLGRTYIDRVELDEDLDQGTEDGLTFDGLGANGSDNVWVNRYHASTVGGHIVEITDAGASTRWRFSNNDWIGDPTTTPDDANSMCFRLSNAAGAAMNVQLENIIMRECSGVDFKNVASVQASNVTTDNIGDNTEDAPFFISGGNVVVIKPLTIVGQSGSSTDGPILQMTGSAVGADLDIVDSGCAHFTSGSVPVLFERSTASQANPLRQLRARLLSNVASSGCGYTALGANALSGTSPTDLNVRVQGFDGMIDEAVGSFNFWRAPGGMERSADPTVCRYAGQLWQDTDSATDAVVTTSATGKLGVCTVAGAPGTWVAVE